MWSSDGISPVQCSSGRLVTNLVDRQDQRVFVEGNLNSSLLHYFLATLHNAVENAGYRELCLDFSKCTAAFPESMLAIAAQVTQLRESGVYCYLTLPSGRDLARLFVNANWAYLLDPRSYDPSRFKGFTRVPATQFKGPDQQQEAVNRIVNSILGALSDIDRADFAAFEWSVNELTDNVLTHSESQIGGLVQVSWTFLPIQKR